MVNGSGNNSISQITAKNQFVKNTKNFGEVLNFKNSSIIFSFVGPILAFIFLYYFIPVSEEFKETSSISQFTIQNNSLLINLTYLMITFCILSNIGLMLTLIHKKIILLIFNLFSIILAFWVTLPLLKMIIPD